MTTHTIQQSEMAHNCIFKQDQDTSERSEAEELLLDGDSNYALFQREETYSTIEDLNKNMNKNGITLLKNVIIT